MAVILGMMDGWMTEIRRKPPYLLSLRCFLARPGVGVRWASSSRVLSLLPSVLDNEDIT
jgi:hypothetical protein